MNPAAVRATIVDYGLGNLFSVKQALNRVGAEALITSRRRDLERADLVVLPGVGAYGDAMAALTRLDLVRPLQDLAAAGKHLVGICLGQQLFLTESEEFGANTGLNLIPGRVIRFPDQETAFPGDDSNPRRLKVPQVGWNRIRPPKENPQAWSGSPLAGTPPESFMYFVHSFYTVPDNPETILALARYGEIDFCAGLRSKNLFACQFHPERSGPLGLEIYRALIKAVQEADKES